MARLAARLERGLLAAGLTVVAYLADWLLDRRLRRDRALGGESPGDSR